MGLWCIFMFDFSGFDTSLVCIFFCVCCELFLLFCYVCWLVSLWWFLLLWFTCFGVIDVFMVCGFCRFDFDFGFKRWVYDSILLRFRCWEDVWYFVLFVFIWVRVLCYGVYLYFTCVLSGLGFVVYLDFMVFNTLIWVLLERVLYYFLWVILWFWGCISCLHV